MSKTREIPYIHYVCERNCALGKNATFYGHCQTCPTYRAKSGAKPARTDNRKEKLAKINKKEMKIW